MATDEDNHREGPDITAEPLRAALLVPRSQRLLLDLDGGHTLAMVYPGLSLLRTVEGRVIEELWLPQGEDASDTDDEVLIAALRDAVLWTAQKS